MRNLKCFGVFLVGLLSACSQLRNDSIHSLEHPVTVCSTCRMYEKTKRAVVHIETPIGVGSGAIVDAKGLVVTNSHVVKEFPKVRITLYDGRQFEGKIIRNDKNLDIAIVIITASPKDLTAITMSSSDYVQEGQEIFVIGHPFNLRWTVTRGIVSSKRGPDDLLMPNRIQIDAPISPGSSGGPVLTPDGKVVAIVTSKVQGKGAENLGFACPAELIIRLLDK